MVKTIGTMGDDTLTGTNNFDTLRGKEGNDTLLGLKSSDKLFGGEGNDSLDGGADNDTLRGAWDNDLLRGDEGDDIVFGNSGDDTLIGGTGDDNLWGGTGADLFRFHLGDGSDTLGDFKQGFDHLELETGLWVGTFDQTALDSMSTVLSGGLRIDFQDGTSIDLLGLTNTAGLIDDITLI